MARPLGPQRTTPASDTPRPGGYYQWRARSYPLAERAIHRAQAIHGEPVPTCTCGRLLEFCGDRVFPCPDCDGIPPRPAPWWTRCTDCGYLLDAEAARDLGVLACDCPLEAAS